MLPVHMPSRVPSPKEWQVVLRLSRQGEVPEAQTIAEIKAGPSGFSLIEFLVAIAILGILVTAAVPSFHTAILNSRITTQVNRFIGALHLARSEAVKRGIPVTLCKTANPYANTPACSTSSTTGWEKGWLLFVDKNDDGKFRTTNGDKLLRVYEPLKGNNTLRGNQNVSKYINYTSTGVTRKTVGSLILCDERGFKDRASVGIVLSFTGRPRIEDDMNNLTNDTSIASCQP